MPATKVKRALTTISSQEEAAEPQPSCGQERSCPAPPAPGAGEGRDEAPGRREGRGAAPMAKPAVTAQDLALKQREISVSEFFTKNRHLLGFDNPSRALLATVKEAVDNSLDACQEAHVLPEIFVEVRQIEENRFRVIVEDNGPGIVRQQIPKIFGKLLYGSKFHTLKQSRGQQGIGISAAGMYGQLTTGKPVAITSCSRPGRPAHAYEIQLDTERNQPIVLKEAEVEWKGGRCGTRVEIELEGRYQKGRHSVDAYLQQTALANPHVEITYVPPKGEAVRFERQVESLPPDPKEIRPHPYGVELGVLQGMLKAARGQRLSTFLCTAFSRVSRRTADEICSRAGLKPESRVHLLALEEVERLFKAIGATRILAPPTNCLSPIGEEVILRSLRGQIRADFYSARTRAPVVYRGNPFLVEVGLAYGGELPAEEPITLYRFANRVPLLFQQSACAITDAVLRIDWKSYGLAQPRGSLPIGPAAVLVHVASVWVPFTSESKEAIADYEEIVREIRLALQECGRQMGRFVQRRRREAEAERKRSYIEKYIPHIGEALQEILGLPAQRRASIEENLKDMLERSRS